MTKRTKFILIYILGIATGILIIAQMAFRENKKDIATKAADAVNAGTFTSPKLPKEMSFAGEKVPLERLDVQEMFDRELIYNYYSQGHMLYLLKLSKRFFPIIEQRLKDQGIPDDFKYLCVAESNLQNLTSHVGAQGYWQFMSSTAPGYNLEVSNDVDDRYKIENSTDAACKYLKQAYAKFGNWTAAAASYNCGMGGYNSQATFQKTKYYYDLQLPVETNKYIFRILSFKHIFTNAEQLGFRLTNDDLYRDIPTRTLTVSSSITNLADWAITNGSNYKMLKLLNPWLRSRSLSVKPGKRYEIKLPK
jgi:membrane-bound lytic murein transglycosylase D